MKYSEIDYKNKCKSLSLQYIGFHKEKKKGTIIEYICYKHKNKGIQNSDWSHFKNYSIGCPYCTGRYKTTEEIQTEIDKLDLNVKLMSSYQGSEKSIDCQCKICSNKWTTTPKVLLSNKSSCPKCGRIKANHHEMKSHDDFILDLNKANPLIKPMERYTGCKNWIQCKCLVCNKTFKGKPSRLLRRESGCPYCNLSGGELSMLIALDNLNITYERQYSIKECRYILPLRFDAFDTTNNVAFEYNGEQHYYPIKMKSKKYDSEKQFELTQNRDRAKKDYCHKHNISLIIVPYWERDNIEEYIKKELERSCLYC